MTTSLVVRCEEAATGETVTRIFEYAKYSSAVELQIGEDLVNRCSVLRDLKHVLGEAPLPQVDPQSFRLWIRGDYDGHAAFSTALGALQVLHFVLETTLPASRRGCSHARSAAHIRATECLCQRYIGYGALYCCILTGSGLQVAIFLGDDRQDVWAQVAGTLLFSCLASISRASGTPAHVVDVVESLGSDVTAKLLSAAPLDCILAHFSRESHARAIQLRTHNDDNGPHLTIEVSERFSAVHAAALIAALNSFPTADQHVSVTVRPSWHAFPPGSPRLHPSLSTHASAAWGTPFVSAERWLAAVTAVAESLAGMPHLRHLFCISCSLNAAAASSLPLASVATLHLRENDIGTVGFAQAEQKKPLLDSFVRRLVTTDVSKLPYNTTIQVCAVQSMHNCNRTANMYSCKGSEVLLSRQLR